MGVKRDEAGLTRAFRAGIFLNVVLMCGLATALAVGLVAVTREASYRTDLRFDLTRDARYALDDEEKALLRSIDAPVECLFAWGFDEDLMQRVLDVNGNPRFDYLGFYYLPILNDAKVRIGRILEEWSKVSPHVKVRVISDVQSPQEVDDAARSLSQGRAEILNKVILRQGPRRRDVPLRRMMEDMQWGMFPPMPGAPAIEPRMPAGWHVHGELHAALRSLLSGEPVRVAVPKGKDALAEPGGDLWHGLAALLDGEGYALEPIDLAKVESVPPGIGIVLVPAIRMRLESREVEVLQRYERAGGRLLLVADPRYPEDYARLLEPYGCTWLPGMAEDRRHQSPSRRGPADLESDALCVGRHAIDRPLKGRVRLYAGPCRPLQVATDRAPGAERTTLLEASDEARLIPVEFDAAGKWELREAAARPLQKSPGTTERSLAAALSRPALDRPGSEARLVLFGGSSILSPRELTLATHFGNRDLLLNALAWLGNRDLAIGLSPRDEVQARTVSLGRVMTPFLLVAVLGFPLVAAVAGLTVHFMRRS